MDQVTPPEGWSTVTSGYDIDPDTEVLAYLWSAWRYVYAVDRRALATARVSYYLEPHFLGGRVQRAAVERIVVRTPPRPLDPVVREVLAIQNARYHRHEEARRKMKKSS